MVAERPTITTSRSLTLSILLHRAVQDREGLGPDIKNLDIFEGRFDGL